MRIILTFCLVLAGCNTMNGLGDDMQQAGAKLSNKATHQQEVMSYPDDSPIEDTYSPYQP